MERVSVRACDDYENENVERAVDALFADINGEALFKKGEKILVKANLLNNFKVDSAVTTHPKVIEAVCKKLVSFGCEPIIGDSSAGFYNQAHMGAVYKTCGMTVAAENSGAKLNDDFSTASIEYNEAKVGKRFEIIGVAEKVDGIVNVAKLKTHRFTMYTGCSKNMFGLIPGMQKVQRHAEYKDVLKFTDFIIDVNEYIKDKVRLNIIDAVIGMEGDGPSAGDPKKLGVMLASKSSYAADVAAIKIINGETKNFPLFYELEKRDIKPNCVDDIELVGDNIKDFVCKSFKLVRDDRLWCKEGNRSVFSVLYPIKKFITPYPTAKKSECKGCGRCAEHCPGKAITMKNGKATFDLNKCIRCYCCQELCPYHVIKVKKKLTTKIMEKI